jgi:hypothetical protein
MLLDDENYPSNSKEYRIQTLENKRSTIQSQNDLLNRRNDWNSPSVVISEEDNGSRLGEEDVRSEKNVYEYFTQEFSIKGHFGFEEEEDGNLRIPQAIKNQSRNVILRDEEDTFEDSSLVNIPKVEIPVNKRPSSNISEEYHITEWNAADWLPKKFNVSKPH